MPDFIFSSLGFEVLRESEGIYHLRLPGTGREFVALLHAAAPLTGNSDSLYFISYEIPRGVAVDVLLQHWKTLDARRLVQSGLYPQSVTISLAHLPPGYPADKSAEYSIPRPYGTGNSADRVAIKLATGEVVCYN